MWIAAKARDGQIAKRHDSVALPQDKTEITAIGKVLSVHIETSSYFLEASSVLSFCAAMKADAL